MTMGDDTSQLMRSALLISDDSGWHLLINAGLYVEPSGEEAIAQ